MTSIIHRASIGDSWTQALASHPRRAAAADAHITENIMTASLAMLTAQPAHRRQHGRSLRATQDSMYAVTAKSMSAASLAAAIALLQGMRMPHRAPSLGHTLVAMLQYGAPDLRPQKGQALHGTRTRMCCLSRQLWSGTSCAKGIK